MEVKIEMLFPEMQHLSMSADYFCPSTYL